VIGKGAFGGEGEAGDGGGLEARSEAKDLTIPGAKDTNRSDTENVNAESLILAQDERWRRA
jgi:hypothetical protein